MPREWCYENDDEGLAGDLCDQWIIRDLSTDNHDIIAVVPKTGDEAHDHLVTWPNARLIAAAPELLEACKTAKKFLEPDLVEPGRTVFWNLVSVISKATGGTSHD